MIKLEAKSMTNATENARRVRAHVRVVSADQRVYAVTGSNGDVYTVRFSVRGKEKFGECSCRSGEFNKMCRHIPQAAQVNVMVQSMRRAAR